METENTQTLTYQERIDLLRATKMRHTEEKWRDIGIIDMDDSGSILPPPGSRRYVEVISGSGVPMKDVLFSEFTPTSNHPSGGLFGARACGENYRALLEMHPTYVDPVSSLAGGYMVNFLSYRTPQWNPDFDYSHLKPEQELYGL
ncbi:MAG: formate acetyltransferase 2, partial [Bacteroidetes bacterium]|nr:formate acetyltransferase 2 [Bacteroidota bacterium]